MIALIYQSSKAQRNVQCHHSWKTFPQFMYIGASINDTFYQHYNKYIIAIDNNLNTK